MSLPITLEWYAVRAVVLYRAKILLMFRRKVIGSIVEEYYVTLGWWCEKGESFEDALRRELMEEAWLKNIVIKDTISDYLFDDMPINCGISRKISKIYLVESYDWSYLQVTEWTGPEAKKSNDSNQYEIREFHRNDLPLLSLRPDKLKIILIEYGLRKGYIH